MTTADIIRRKATAQRPQTSEGTPGADRAFRFGLGKAARDAIKIQLEVEKLSIDRRFAAELVEIFPDFSLIAVLDGPKQAVGVMVLSQAIVAGFVEAQTIGRVRGQDLVPRKPTRTDGAMVKGIIDVALATFEQSLGENADIVWAGGFRCASFLADPRPLPVVLEDAPLRVLTADVSLSGGLRKGIIYLALPAEGHLPLPTAQKIGEVDELGLAFGAALQDRVVGANVQLDAVLARVSLPMADVLGMAEGKILPLQDASLERISLEGTDGRCVALGKLGQNRGMRALRLVDGQETVFRKTARAGRVLAAPYPGESRPSVFVPTALAGAEVLFGLPTPRTDGAQQEESAGDRPRPRYASSGAGVV
jgi:flagellar motor switch protein FliM